MRVAHLQEDEPNEKPLSSGVWPELERSTRIDRILARWLDSLAPWTHALTVTCKRRNLRNIPINESILVDTAKHFIYRARLKCFGRRGRRENLLPVAVSLGWGVYGDHPHLHFCFAGPPWMDFDSFSRILEKSAKGTRWMDRQMKVEAYRNRGWMQYLVEHGTDQLIVPLITPSTSACH